jgi:aldose sugar dehydrogenase
MNGSVRFSMSAGMLALLAACVPYNGQESGGTSAAPPTAQTPAPPGGTHAFRVVTVAEGLIHPWSIAFLPDGELLVTERPGRLRVVRNGVLQAEPVSGVPEVRARGQGGLLEVKPHPDFASNRLLYLTYSKPRGEDEATTAVARGRYENGRLTDVRDIFVAEAWSSAGQHFGSKLAFDGRGHIYITVGDRGARPVPATLREHPSQNLRNHQGTVIRLHDDGRIPSDNPFVGRSDALPEIWSYGHRNAQGLAIHPQTGEVWLNEHGPQGGDELNLVQPGRNYGWPVVGYGVQYGGAEIHVDTTAPGMTDPAHHWTPSIAVSGLMIYTGDAFPNWRGSFFNGALAGQHIARLTMDGHRVTSEERIFEQQGRVRDVQQGPDGFIYVAIDHRGGDPTAVVRLEPAP